jgi:hypothetical protein
MAWIALEPAGLPKWQSRRGIDAQLVWAEATGYRDFAGRPAEGPLPFIVEMHDGHLADDLGRELAAAAGRGRLNPLYAGKPTRWCTAWLAPAYLAEVLMGRAGAMIRRFALQVSMQPQRPRPTRARAATPAFGPQASSSDVLLGVIDDGHPFARHALLDAARGCRTLGLWDQNAADGPCAALPYGRAWSHTELDAVLARHATGAAVDEAGCYESLGFEPLRRRVSHGAFVTDLFAGALSLGQRLRRDADAVPAWTPTGDVASRCDLVFVQTPITAPQDSSSAALPALLLDGLRFVLLHRGANTSRIVVDISDGTSRGGHDGQSILERALVGLIDEVRADGRCAMHIVVAAGNANLEARHAQIDRLEPGMPQELRLLVQPGSEFPSQLVLRVPPDAADLEVSLTAPGSTRRLSARVGEGFGWRHGERLLWSIVLPLPLAGEAGEGLLSFAPTLSLSPAGGCVTAPAGVWRIGLRSRRGVANPVHLHVCRAQQNPGTLDRARQARFIDADGQYDPERYLREAEVDAIPARSPLRRQGTLNGLATSPPGQGIVVVAATAARLGKPCNWTASGPSATGGRNGPDAAGVTDVSTAQRGLTGAAVASGDRTRMRGASFSAPQVAREIANTGAAPARLFGPGIAQRTGAGTMEPQ